MTYYIMLGGGGAGGYPSQGAAAPTAPAPGPL